LPLSPIQPEAPGNADDAAGVGFLAMLLQQVKPLPGVGRRPTVPNPVRVDMSDRGHICISAVAPHDGRD